MERMNFRGVLPFLAFVPVISFGHLPRVVKPATPRTKQSQEDRARRVSTCAPNARLRVEVHVGSPDTVPITVTEDGAAVPIARTALPATGPRDPRTVELVPERPLKPGATIIVSVDGIRSGTYRVEGAPDTTAPKLGSVSIDAVINDSRSRHDTSVAHDEVIVTVGVSDESAVRLRAFVMGADGGRVESQNTVFASTSNPTATLLQFPAGTLPTSGPVKLRLEAADAAGNIATSPELEYARGAAADAGSAATPAAAPSAPAPAAPPERRGCL